MAQQAEETGPVPGQNNAGKAVAHHDHLGDPHTKQNGHDGFEHVGEDDHQGQGTAEGAVEVGQARVAAAVIANVIPQDILGDNDRSVKAAAEIGHHGYQRGKSPPLHFPVVDTIK